MTLRNYFLYISFVHTELAVVCKPWQHLKSFVIFIGKPAQQIILSERFDGKYTLEAFIRHHSFYDRRCFVDAGNDHFFTVNANSLADISFTRRAYLEPFNVVFYFF